MTRKPRQIARGAAGLGLMLIGLLWFQLHKMNAQWHVVLMVASVTAIILASAAVRRMSAAKRRHQLLATTMRTLTPKQFELFVASLLRELGWREVRQMGGAGDRGVDVWAVDPEGRRVAVQCKLYTKRVGPDKVRELIGTVHRQRADRGVLVTNSYFTAQGEDEARTVAIELWDGTVLSAKLAAAVARHDRHSLAHRRWHLLLLAALRLNLGMAGWGIVAQRGYVYQSRSLQLTTATPDTQLILQAVTNQATAARQDAPREAAATATQLCGVATVVTVEWLKLRAAPGIATATLGEYPRGTLVQLRCTPQVVADGLPWQPVVVGGAEGWMSDRMLRR